MTGTERRVTLTFDNGPTPGVTDDVLNVLDRHDVRSTFFACGQQLLSADGRRLLRRAVEAGHWAGNHTMTHSASLGVQSAPDDLRREIGAAQEMLGSAAHPDRFFRPRGAGGKLDKQLLSTAAVDYLAAGNYSLVLWTSVPRDWEDPAGWVSRALADVRAQDWTVLVVHDIASGAMRLLAEAIARIRDTGAAIVQEFPASAVPMYRGQLRAPVGHLVCDAGVEDPSASTVR
jgi:peptidoglycan/xylan/chitin deacetylase (PgdA/CDA1 family)